MPQRRILFLDSTRLAAYRIGGGTVTAEGAFVADTAGLAAFGTYLGQHRHSLFMLLTEVADEGFQLEDIPAAKGRDRDAIVTRKLAQYFYGTPFTAAQSHGRLPDGRRDERLLMMALTQPQNFEPWLAVLRDHQAILRGIYSLPQVVQQLVPRQPGGQLLLITRTRAGLRQTFCVDGQLRFSRLTPLATGTNDEAAMATALEANKTHQYLASQRLIERGKPLLTRVLAHPAQLAALQERCRDAPQLHFEVADLLQEARRVGLRSPLAEGQAELLFCHLLARRPPAAQLAPPAERRYYRLWQTRFALKGVSAVVLAAGLLFAAKQGLDILQTNETTAQIRQQTQLDQQRYDTALQALPKIPLSTDNLRALVDRYDEVIRRAKGPAPLFVQLSQSLDAFPRIALDRIEWRVSERIEAIQGSAPQPVPPALATGPYAEAIVDARLPLASVGDQRGQLTLVAEFTKHLGTAPDTLVAILQPPVDTQSGKTLKSGDENRSPEAPKFTFRLIRKL